MLEGIEVVQSIAIIATVGGGFYWGGRVKQQTEDNTKQLEKTASADTFEAFSGEVFRRLDRIEDKIDKNGR